MKSHMKFETLQVPNDNLIKIVKQNFKEYLKFINYSDIEIPNNVNFKFYNGLDRSNSQSFIAQLYIPNNDSETFTLTFEQLDCVTQRKEVFYHEFTHLMDYMIVNKNIPFKDRLSSLHYVSEIRATYFEYLTRCGIAQISENINLSPSTKVISSIKFGKTVKLDEEIYLYQEQLIANIKKRYKNKKDFNTFFKSYIEYSYYLGLILMIKKHSHITIDQDCISNLLTEFMGESIKLYSNILDIISVDFSPIKQSVLDFSRTINDVSNNFYKNNFLK